MTKTDAASDSTLSDSTIKYYVLDTNVLLHNPEALFVFQENHVVIPYPVIEELDTMKTREDDVGRSARSTIRHLDRLRGFGDLMKGVDISLLGAKSLGATGTLAIDIDDHDRPPIISKDTPDNRIIASAWSLMKEGHLAVFVSKDLAARIKSDALGIRTEDFLNQRVDAERLYTGYAEIESSRDLIDELYQNRMLSLQKARIRMSVK
jgi:PhoH-like ATPase